MRALQRPLAILSAVVLLSTTLLLAPAQAQTPKQGGTFIFARGGDSVKLDPAVIEDGESARVTNQIFETLVKFDGSTTNIIPALATSWENSSDGLTWTFKLRQGVKFHDGTPFNAQAVKFNFDRWGDKNNPYHRGGDFVYYEEVADWDTVIKSTEVVDDYTFRVHLNKPQGPFLANAALFTFAIVSPKAIQDDIDNLFKNPVGTGPFKFVEWVPGDHITLIANAEYWGGRPYLDSVVLRVIPDNAARFLELQTGLIDMMEGSNPDDVAAAKSNPDLQVLLRPPLNIGYVDLNQLQPPLDNLNVRKAMAYAINRARIVETLYAGTGVVAKEFLAPGMLGYSEDLPDIPYDPEQARKLLADAGYPDGFTIDFWYMPVSRPYFPNPQPIAEAICSDLAQVKIICNLKSEDWGAYLEDSRQFKFPVFMLGWTGDNGDPDNFLFTFFGEYKGNRNSWDNARARELIAQAAALSDPARRAPLYHELNRLVYEEMPKIPIAHTTPPLLARSYVRGYLPNPTSTEYYNTVWLDK